MPIPLLPGSSGVATAPAFAAWFERAGDDSLAIVIDDEFTPPALEPGVVLVGGTSSGPAQVASEVLGTPVEMELPVQIQGASNDALKAAVAALDLYLRKSCILCVRPSTATVPTCWKVIYAKPVQPRYTEEADGTWFARVTLRLICDPFVWKPETALYQTVAISSPAIVDLSTMEGSYASPLVVEVRGSTTPLTSLYLAIGDGEFDDYLTEAELMYWTNGTLGADGGGTGGTSWRIDGQSVAAFDSGSFPEGPYLLLARVAALQDGQAATIGTSLTDHVHITSYDWHVIELGTVRLPTRQVRGNATAPLEITVEGTEVWIDWLYCLPLADAAIWYTGGAGAGTFRREAGTTYLDDRADEANVTGTTLKCLKGSLLVVTETGDVAAQDLFLTVLYSPRWAWLY